MADNAKKTERVLRIRALPEKGFWRAGIKHTRAETDHPVSKFSNAQIAQLKNEPMLHVQEVDVPVKGEPAK